MMNYGEELRNWVASVRQEIPALAVPESHVPTPNERNNVVHLCFKQFFGHGMRPADLALLESMCQDIKDLPDFRARYISNLAEFIWDHWMGGPEDPTVEDVGAVCLVLSDLLFAMGENVRNDISDLSEKQAGE